MTIGQYIKSTSPLNKFDFITVYQIMIILLDEKKLNMHDFIDCEDKNVSAL